MITALNLETSSLSQEDDDRWRGGLSTRGLIVSDFGCILLFLRHSGSPKRQPGPPRVPPGTPLNEIIRIGESDHEPTCLSEGIKRVVDREVELHFHRVVRTKAAES